MGRDPLEARVDIVTYPLHRTGREDRRLDNDDGYQEQGLGAEKRHDLSTGVE
jgi:hypothetical protein